MAGLICLCEERMGGSACPNDNFVEIYTKEALEKEIQNGTDFIDLMDEIYTYWYCTKCKRLTLTLNETGQYYRSFSRVVEKKHPVFTEVAEWREYMFWRDREFYDAIEENDKQTVEEFLRDHPSRYLILLSPDESKAYVFSPKTKEYLFSYIQDPMPDFSILDKDL